MISIPNQLSLSDVLSYFGVGAVAATLAWVTIPDLWDWSQISTISVVFGIIVFVCLYLIGLSVLAIVEVVDSLTKNNEGERFGPIQKLIDLILLQCFVGAKHRRESVEILLDRYYLAYRAHFRGDGSAVEGERSELGDRDLKAELEAGAVHFACWGPESEYVGRLRAFRTFSKSCSLCFMVFAFVGFVGAAVLGLYEFPRTISWIPMLVLSWLFAFLSESFRQDSFEAMAQRGLSRLQLSSKSKSNT